MKSEITTLRKWELFGIATKDRRLTTADNTVLWLILDKIGQDGYAEIGFGALSKSTGFHRATIVRSISRLFALGYIEKRRNRDR